MKIILKFIKDYKLVLLGAIMFSVYIWARFIRGRLPKDIPFTPSILGFFILVEICLIYAYVVYSLMRPPKDKEHKKLVEDIISFVYKPLEDFDFFLKNSKIIRKKYKKFILYLADKFKYIIIDTNIFYFIFAIFPRLVLISAMFIDVFYFHKLYYIYKVLLIGILLFLNRYIIYCFKAIKKVLLNKFNLYVNTVTTSYVYGTHPDDNEDDEDWEPHPTMSLPPEIFVDYQMKSIVYSKIKKEYMIIDTTFYYQNKYKRKYNIPREKSIPSTLFDILDLKKTKRLDTIVDLAVLIEYYNLADSHKDLNLIRKLIFITYLIFWVYILIVSLPNLDLLDLIKVINSTWLNAPNPFF